MYDSLPLRQFFLRQIFLCLLLARAEPWEGTLEAVHTYKLCPQVVSVAFAYDELIPFKNSLNHDDNSSDEDCLKLNVFTPQHEKNTKLPVRQCFTRLPVCLRLNSPKSWLVEILTFVKSMGVGKGGGGRESHGPPEFSHPLS